VEHEFIALDLRPFKTYLLQKGMFWGAKCYPNFWQS
jgi:hypothetical protein